MGTLQKPQKIEDFGISNEFVQEIILKTIYVHGAQLGKSISQNLKTPFPIIEDLLVKLKKRDLIGVIGASSIASGYHSMEFELTPKGRTRAQEIMKSRSYVGAIPVTLDEYQRVIAAKKMKTRTVKKNKVQDIFSNITLNKSHLALIGPAINSGGPILFYGKPGNGKTMIAEKLIDAFDDYIYVPYCLMVDGQFIKYFDEKVHDVITYDTVDPRWVKIRRPYLVVGGELTLPMLDLVYKDDFKYYEAPPQLKANGGVLLIDDFGRQLVSPKALLNRWIYPLEKKVDYLTLVTGKKIEVPFNQMIIFSSNLNPSQLGDDAFLRRIKYKIEIPSPDKSEFKKIFKRCCENFSLEFSEEAFNYLVSYAYENKKRDFRGCHPRDLLSHVVDYNTFNAKGTKLTKESINFACKSYFS